MAAVYDYLEERYGGLPANEQTLRNFIRYLIRSNKLQFQQSTRIYQQVPPLPFGKQMQLDFGQYRMDSGLVLYNFLTIRDFDCIKKANSELAGWLKRRANGKISQAIGQIPALLIASERKKLRPVNPSIFRKNSILARETRNVNEKGCISVLACNYQLPTLPDSRQDHH